MGKPLAIIHPEHRPAGRLRAAVFDFDGTLSTLRHGWESVMRPMMLEYISGGQPPQPETARRVEEYIEASTGIQTIYQMKWLAGQVEQAGYARPERDEWWYKDEYNRRLMVQVEERLEALESGQKGPEEFLIEGAPEFLQLLRSRGLELFLASGTDHRDVEREAGALGMAQYFSLIKGAPERQAACSKEAVLRMLLEEKGIAGSELLLVGDGKVEIALGASIGAYTLGIASDEQLRHGLNPAKQARLVQAGADAVTGDFTSLSALLDWLDFS